MKISNNIVLYQWWKGLIQRKKITCIQFIKSSLMFFLYKKSIHWYSFPIIEYFLKSTKSEYSLLFLQHKSIKRYQKAVFNLKGIGNCRWLNKWNNKFRILHSRDGSMIIINKRWSSNAPWGKTTSKANCDHRWWF